jgi:hypothetical protein
MSNTVLAIIGALVSMLTMIGFSVVQFEKLDAGSDRDTAADPDHEVVV